MKVLKCWAVALLWLGLCAEVFAQESANLHKPLHGVDMIPPEAIQLTREQMRKLFVVSDSYAVGTRASVDRLRDHNEEMREVACLASVMPCSDPHNLRTTPFTFLAKYPLLRYERDVTEWIVREAVRRGSKIVTESKTNVPGGGSIEDVYSSSLPFVLISGTGNDGVDNFFNPFTYDRLGNRFTRNGRTVTGSTAATLRNYLDIVKAQKVIYASTYKTVQGVPRRNDGSTGCLGVEESCVSLPSTQLSQGGTSTQSPTLGAAMASVLGVFPQYDVSDLTALVNSCAHNFPSIIGGVVNMPCVIETICAETNSTSSVCDIAFPDPVFNDTRIGVLENPGMTVDMLYAERSGISVISGWVCEAEEIVIELNGTEWKAGYGTTRTDTKGECGDVDNGFSLLFNWNLLGDGIHAVKAYADGRKFAAVQVKVATLGKEFVRLPKIWDKGEEFPGREEGIGLRWSNSLQNLVITDGTDMQLEQGYSTVPAVHGFLENPSLGSYQSGISAISGWVCDAEEIVIELNGAEWKAGYGTTRTDTQGECGDTDNGFSLLFNWNLLGDGIHTVKAYADGVLFASTEVKVTTLGKEFVRGVETFAAFTFEPFSEIMYVNLEWWEPIQNFVIVHFSDVD